MRYHSLINHLHCLTYITDIVGLKLSLVASMYWQTQVTVFLIFLCFIPIGIKVEKEHGSRYLVAQVLYIDAMLTVPTYLRTGELSCIAKTGASLGFCNCG